MATEMSITTMILALGMPALTIIILILASLIKGIFQTKPKMIWGLIISLGLFDLAMILEHMALVSTMFLVWAHLTLPIGMYLIYLSLSKKE